MSTTERYNLLLIMGSVRAGRRCPQIASWVRGLAEQSAKLNFEIIDLRDWTLPASDEPGMPAQGKYTQEHTCNWSAKVAGTDGVVIVTPQYNWGYPAPLKNALDHLYNEWSNKPLAIVTYGGHGGGKCGTQLRQIAEGLKMRLVTTMPAITIARERIENDTQQSAEEMVPFEAEVVQAMRELRNLLI